MILGRVHGLGLCFGRKLVTMGTEIFIAVGASGRTNSLPIFNSVSCQLTEIALFICLI